MATEPNLNAVPSVLLTANGSTDGVLQVVDTAGFYIHMQALLSNNANQTLTVYIKRVVNSTTLWVGATRNGMDHNVDVSMFTTATLSNISAQEQKKQTVPMEARLLATYENDPVDAWRTIPVDGYGNHYNSTNPLPVAFDGTVQIGDVSIVEGGNTLKVNNDGSINVIVESVPNPNSTVVNTYNELNLAGGNTAFIVSYTVPVGMQAIFQRAQFSGENIARYDLFLNGTIQATARTNYAGDYTGEFNFTSGNDSGMVFSAGQTIQVQVYNFRPSAASFEGRIQVLVIPA